MSDNLAESSVDTYSVYAFDMPQAATSDRRFKPFCPYRVLAARLIETPDFARVVQGMCANLSAIFESSPRIGKLMGSQRRWLMVQVGFALYHERVLDPSKQGLTASRLADVIEGLDIASRNTVSSFLGEMKAYKYLAPIPGNIGRRTQPLGPTPPAVASLSKWLMAHLKALDYLDDGKRAREYDAAPERLVSVQAEMMRILLKETDFLYPSATITNFIARESGGLVLDDLIAGISDINHADADGFFRIGKLNISKLARRFQLSRINLDRIIRQAEVQGTLKRNLDGSHAMTKSFLDEQLWRMALKFAAIETAWKRAVKPEI